MEISHQSLLKAMPLLGNWVVHTLLFIAYYKSGLHLAYALKIAIIKHVSSLQRYTSETHLVLAVKNLRIRKFQAYCQDISKHVEYIRRQHKTVKRGGLSSQKFWLACFVLEWSHKKQTFEIPLRSLLLKHVQQSMMIIRTKIKLLTRNNNAVSVCYHTINKLQ